MRGSRDSPAPGALPRIQAVGSRHRGACMRRRVAIMVIAIVAFIAAVGFFKYRQIRTAMAQGASFKPPPESVTTTVVRTEPWPAMTRAIGTVSAVHGVTVSADLPGQVKVILFQSGRLVRKGDLL